jgi:hypothetical protein
VNRSLHSETTRPFPLWLILNSNVPSQTDASGVFEFLLSSSSSFSFPWFTPSCIVCFVCSPCPHTSWENHRLTFLVQPATSTAPGHPPSNTRPKTSGWSTPEHPRRTRSLLHLFRHRSRRSSSPRPHDDLAPPFSAPISHSILNSKHDDNRITDAEQAHEKLEE